MPKTDLLNPEDYDRISKAVGVSRSAVRMAKFRGYLPATWWHLCDQANLDLPPEMFNFRRAAQHEDI